MLSAFIDRHAHFSRFLLVGSANTAVDLILFFIFANLLSVTPVLASIGSTGITMCLSFYLNHHYVFQSERKKRHTAFQFVAATIFNVWVVQSVIIWSVIHVLNHKQFFVSHHWTLNVLAKLCGIGVSFILNFLMYRYIFHQKTPEESVV